MDGLQKIGFDYVLHTNFAADLTIWEEGHELLERLQEGRNLPMFTSCCPGWVRFAEVYYPGLLNHLSTCKSPQQMFGALVKTYWAEKMGIDPEKIVSVSIMPCTAKKYEAVRPGMIDSRYPDVDMVLTTEIADFRMTGIDLKLAGAPFAAWMGNTPERPCCWSQRRSYGSFCVRYANWRGNLEKIDFCDVRGMKGVKEATVYLNGKPVRVAVAHSLSNARVLMEQVAAGESPYHFIEVMACPGGCIGGGGQPLTRTDRDRARRMQAIYDEDRGRQRRKAHENQEVKALYQDYLGSVMSHKAHELLHTRYTLKKEHLTESIPG